MAFDRFTHERERLAKGCERIAGVDEVGRGPLAGPVVAAAAVFLPEHIRDGLAKPLDGVNDSKKLSAKKRESLFELLRSLGGFEFGIALVEPAEIDRINILQATHRAMEQALAALGQAPEHVLVDGRPVASLGQAQTALVKGASLSYSIAAASI
ncbi:MAG: ribonuclease HII, partial [Verrucomicrobia bacterium]|nr:ribonuclease HII [Verrucomicrobiota bacterium]